jgi:hypothetical protein
LAGYLQALSDPPDCSHLLVVQDDVQICSNFAPALERIVASRPENPISLFLARLPEVAAKDATRAMKANQRYIRLRSRAFVPVVALLWPIEESQDFLEFVSDTGGPRLASKRSDDAAVWQWMANRRKAVYVTCPSLVEHPDNVPSTIGRRARWGKDKGRVALFYIGEQDPLELEW